MNFVFNYLFKTVVGRWVTGSLIALLLSGAALKWYSFKEGLIDEGVQICVQEINQATMIALEDALADERSANAALTASLVAAAAVNQEATARRVAAESNSIALRNQMENQRDVDPNYKEWSDTPLPDGVADRLRQAAGSQADSTD